MESERFDALARSLVTTGSRRRMLAGLLAGALVSLRVRTSAADDRDDRGTAIADASGGDQNQATVIDPATNQHDHDNDKDKDKKDTDEATCPGLNETCEADPGTQCCPNIDRSVVCAGGLSGNPVCQDCTAPLDPNRALCQDPPGNQCCGGNPACFVAVPIETDKHGAAVCLADAECPVCPDPPEPCVACTDDDFCQANASPGYTVCAASTFAECGCLGNMCGLPC
jgi:hypothetical protein